jgi:hypothetical protein
MSADGSLTRVNNSTRYMWGAQLEQASFQSSYVPTTTTSVLRAADVLTYTAGLTYPCGLWGEGDIPSVSSTDRRMIGVYKTSISTDSVLMAVGSTGAGAFTSYSASAWNGQAVTSALITSNNVFKFAGRVNTNTQRACVNGTLSADDTTVTLPVQNPDVLAIGIDPSGGGNGFFGYIRRIAAFNFAPSDAQLQAMTT